ncbi:MAG: hypothetical protein EXS37_16075 [Opitutus sp.]|nr:hypothetical protein [Opitutus sp.]
MKRDLMRLGFPVFLLVLTCASGAPGAATAEPAEDRPVALPPFMVEEMAKGPPWRYAEAMGYEILSRCDDGITRRVVEAHYQLHVLLAEMLPPSLRFTVSVPRTLILYDEELQPASSKEVISRVMRNTSAAEPADDYVSPGGARGLRVALPTRRFSSLPNLRLWDRDAMAVFMIVRRDEFDRLSLTHDYVSFLVKNRLPALPPWFVSGILTLYGQTTYGGNRLELAPLEWISEAHTEALKKDPKTAPPVRPLDEFLVNKFVAHDGAQTYEPIKAWQAQAALFMRWGLDAEKGARRAAFWKYAERSAVEGTSEPLFQACFGLGYAAAQAQLVAYLPNAVRRTVFFKPAHPAKLPPILLRNANDGQISRIKGDWERMEVPYVKAISADLAPKYLEQARKTLRRAYDRDERDPRLLAVMGLCESDAGNDQGAREFFEAAVKIGPIRPRANYELARLRYAEFRANSAGSGSRISLAQQVDVLTPLFAARADQPPLPEVYELIAEVWAHGASPPTRGHLAVLDEGVRLFPRRTALALRAAELNLQYGFRAEAAALAEIAARTAGDPTSRERAAALLEKSAPR